MRQSFGLARVYKKFVPYEPLSISRYRPRWHHPPIRVVHRVQSYLGREPSMTIRDQDPSTQAILLAGTQSYMLRSTRDFLVRSHLAVGDQVDIVEHVDEGQALLAARLYDVVVSDFWFGDGFWSGLELLRRIRTGSTLQHDLRMFLFVSKDDHLAVKAAAHLDCSGVLMTPINFNIVQKRLQAKSPTPARVKSGAHYRALIEKMEKAVGDPRKLWGERLDPVDPHAEVMVQ